MANEIRIVLDPATQAGLSLSADLRAPDGTLVASVALVETGASAYYSGDAPALAAGDYAVAFIDSGGALVGDGRLVWDGVSEVLPGQPSAVALAVRAELAVELARIDAAISSTVAPDAAANATAVRSELAAELGDVVTLRKYIANRADRVGDIVIILDDDLTELVRLDVSNGGRVPQ